MRRPVWKHNARPAAAADAVPCAAGSACWQVGQSDLMALASAKTVPGVFASSPNPRAQVVWTALKASPLMKSAWAG